MAKSRPVSAAESTAVGSSRMRMRGSVTSALAISTICWRATLSEATGAVGSMSGNPKSASTRPAIRLAAAQSTMNGSPAVGSRPSSTFSATLRWGSRLSS